MNDQNDHSVNVNVSGTPLIIRPAGNAMAVAGFVCALCSIVLFWVPGINFILWILAIVFSGVGWSQANKKQLPHRGLAIAGLVIALVPTTILLFVIFLFVIAA